MKEFIEQLASSAPTPGGGGASACVGALSAALASMVGNLTVGKKTYAAVEDQVKEHLAILESLRTQLLDLVEADAQAFAPLAAAYRMPKGTPAEQEAKEATLQEALVGATEVPLDIMRTALQVVDHIAWMAENGSKMARSDAGVAATFARAAVEGASLNVYINAASMSDEAKARDYRAQADEMVATAQTRCANLFDSIKEAVS